MNSGIKSDNEYICPKTKEWVTLEYCRSFMKNTGCKYLQTCKSVKKYMETKDV